MKEYKVKGKELLKKIEELIHEGNIRRIIVKTAEGKTYLEIPLTVGVIGTLCAPVVAAIGAIAGMVANFKIEVIRTEDGVEEAEIIED
ncbi:MAG: DUF4342 domain-containing protein [Rhodothermaceae bacterium]